MTEVENKITRKPITGVVTSDKRDMTRTVEVKWSRPHAVYGKVQRKVTKYQADDKDNISKVGDKVEIIEVRPISKTKTHKIVQVVEQAK